MKNQVVKGWRVTLSGGHGYQWVESAETAEKCRKRGEPVEEWFVAGNTLSDRETAVALGEGCANHYSETYTGGPWSIDGDILISHADPFEEVVVGRVNISHDFTEDEREANRELISKAPILIELVRAIVTSGALALEKYDELEAACCAALASKQ